MSPGSGQAADRWRVWALGLWLAALQCPAAADPVVRVGLVAYLGDATQFHALEQGYFAAEGLRLEVTVNALGRDSLDQVLDGELDIGAAETTPVVRAAMAPAADGSQFRIVASLLEATGLHSIIAADGSALAGLRDLPGHRLGLSRGTASEYFWYRVAGNHGIDPATMALADISVPDLPAAVAAGRVDAAVTYAPYDAAVLAATAGKGRRLPTGRVFTSSRLLLTRPAFLRRHPDLAARYLRALARAERDVRADPAAVARSFARATGLDEASLAPLREGLDFDLSLAESLVAHLHQQATWAVAYGFAAGPVPAFRDYLDPAPLARVRPRAVRLLE